MAKFNINQLVEKLDELPDEFFLFIETELPDLISVEWLKLVQRNFDNQGWTENGITTPWEKRRNERITSPQMVVRGRLRNGVRARNRPGTAEIGIDIRKFPQAQILNEGGEIEVTPAMRKFFWAMYYKGQEAAQKAVREKTVKKRTEIAGIWKAMALSKKLVIKQRQFIGFNADLNPIIEQLITDKLEPLIP